MNKPQSPMNNTPVSSRMEKRKLKKEEKKRLKKEKKLRKKQKIKSMPIWRRGLRIIGKSILILIILSVLTIGVVASILWNKYGEVITQSITEGYEIASNIKKEDFIQRQPTKVFDVHGNEIKELKQHEYEAPSHEDINPYFLKGVVAVEDSRFYIHHGVDLYGTLRSVYQTFVGGDVQGGSTITQQLVRNVILKDNGVTIERKLKEQVVAQELEKKLSKKEILQHYLNNVYFGNGNYGIGPASRYYFGKDQSELTVDEVAVIIGITNNPTLFDPTKNPEVALDKRNRILNTFKEEGVISEKEYNELVKKPIELNVQEHNIDNRVNDSYALSFAIHKATEELMEANGFVFQYRFDTREEYDAYHERYDEEYAKTRQQIVMGGYEIYTSIDPSVQESLESLVEKELRGFPDKTQLAITTIDNKTGEVVAIVGGRDVKNDYFNRAYQGARQPGSAAKPVVAYANAFERGYTPQSQVIDREIKNGPKNWYRGYWGSMTVRYALEQSVNTVAYRLANQAGPDVFLEKLERMQFAHLTPEDANPIIALGGFTNGVTTVEMASAFSTFARHGKFIEPTNIREIKNIVTKETIVKNDYEKVNVFQEDAAYFTVDSLKSVMTDGTGKSAKPNNYPHVFGKTGTTNDNKDSYFAGGTPYYATAVWIGHDKPSRLSSSEINLSKVLFKKWTEHLHKDLEVIDFEMPQSVYRSGNNLYSRLKTYSDLQATREANEEKRLQKERREQRERLAKEDYRIIHGLTKEEELEREAKTEQAIQEARNFQMQELEDYDKWIELIEKAKELNKRVKHQAAKDAFTARINELEVLAATERQKIIDRIEKEKEEQRRLEEERRREEAEISQLQQELQMWMNRIDSGEPITEEEYRELEVVVQKLKNKGVEVPNIQVEFVEPETEEEITNTNDHMNDSEEAEGELELDDSTQTSENSGENLAEDTNSSNSQ